MSALNKELLMASDETIRTFLQSLYEFQLNDLLTYHLSDEAANCLIRNMNDRARFEVYNNREQTQRLILQSEEAFLLAKEKCKHMRSKYSILFTDLVSSTEKMNNFGDESYYQNVILSHNETLERRLTSNLGRIIKNIGDAYLAIFSDSFLCLKACIDSQNEFKSVNSKRDSDLKILVRMGIHYGELSFKQTQNNHVDVYGKAVNYAARVTTHSQEQEIVCSKAFVDDFTEKRKRWDEYKSANEASEAEKMKARTEELGERYVANHLNYIKECKSNYELCQRIQFVSKAHVPLKGFPGVHELFDTVH